MATGASNFLHFSETGCCALMLPSFVGLPRLSQVKRGEQVLIQAALVLSCLQLCFSEAAWYSAGRVLARGASQVRSIFWFIQKVVLDAFSSVGKYVCTLYKECSPMPAQEEVQLAINWRGAQKMRCSSCPKAGCMQTIYEQPQWQQTQHKSLQEGDFIPLQAGEFILKQC